MRWPRAGWRLFGCRGTPPFAKLAFRRIPTRIRRLHETHAAGRRDARGDADRRTRAGPDLPFRRRADAAARRGATGATRAAAGRDTGHAAAARLGADRAARAATGACDAASALPARGGEAAPSCAACQADAARRLQAHVIRPGEPVDDIPVTFTGLSRVISDDDASGARASAQVDLCFRQRIDFTHALPGAVSLVTRRASIVYRHDGRSRGSRARRHDTIGRTARPGAIAVASGGTPRIIRGNRIGAFRAAPCEASRPCRPNRCCIVRFSRPSAQGRR